MRTSRATGSCRRPRPCWRTPAPPSGELLRSATRSAVRRAPRSCAGSTPTTPRSGNELPYGGFEKLRQRGLEDSTIATWLQAAGYRTALIGKYINRLCARERRGALRVDRLVRRRQRPSELRLRAQRERPIVVYGREPEDYLNDVLTEKAVAVIERAAAREPFFLYVSTFTPHSPAASPPRHKDLFADAELPRPPAFNEPDVGDKPGVIRICRPSTRPRSPGSRTSTVGGCACCRRSTTWSSASSRRSPPTASSI